MTNPLTQSSRITFVQKTKAILRLTRWREHVPFTIPVVVAGALMSVRLNGAALDWRLLPVLVANILAMSFAFMVNDIEDAPDDARDLRKKNHNVISSGILSYTQGISLSITTFIVALGLYALGGWKTFGNGGLTLVLCYLYSASPFRLKARPIVDVISHATMLGGLLMLSGYLIYHAYPHIGWLMILCVTLGSAYGQFYNQLDDFSVDKQVGLKNTAMLLGKRTTLVLMYGSLTGAVAAFVISVLVGIFPSWLGAVALVTIFSLSLFRWSHDMRDTAARASGQMQVPVLLAANITVLMWLVQEMGLLVIPG